MGIKQQILIAACGHHIITFMMQQNDKRIASSLPWHLRSAQEVYKKPSLQTTRRKVRILRGVAINVFHSIMNVCRASLHVSLV
jgi:hypothetical protein